MKREIMVPIGFGGVLMECEFCDIGFNNEHEALGAAIAEAGDRGIDTSKPFTVVWDQLAYTLEVSQEQPED